MDRLFRSWRALLPASRPIITTTSTTCRACFAARRTKPAQTTSFSTTSALQKRNKGEDKRDRRVTLIRYMLGHPLTPRPLRFSRLRYLRHWTIHRAWQLYQAKLRKQQELALERQYNSMREACEVLRTLGRDGMVGGKDEGKLYRRALEKRGIWVDEGGKRVGVPIEYARLQTEWPSHQGWNHEWKRG